MSLAKLVLALTTLVAVSHQAPAHAQGLLGAGSMSVGGSLLGGERLDGGGFGFTAHFEYASMFEETVLGGYMGAEFLVFLGYEKYSGLDPHGGSATQGPLLFDMQVGFPVTLFKVGGGGAGTTLLTLGLGAGFGVQHAYGYVRARVLTALSDKTFIELMGRWTPDEASNDWTDKTGLDLWEARASIVTPVSEDITLQLFAEWSTGDRTRIGDEDPLHPAQTPPEATTPFQSVWRAGVGFVF